MQRIDITIEKSRRYTIVIDGKSVAELYYPKWYSQDAQIMIAGSAYRIKGRGFWKLHADVMKDDMPVFEIKNTWRGTFIKEMHHFYEVKQRGVFKSGYRLVDYKGNDIMEIESDFTWKKFTSFYTVTFYGNDLTEENLLLMLITAHCYRAKQSQNSAIGSAAT